MRSVLVGPSPRGSLPLLEGPLAAARAETAGHRQHHHRLESQSAPFQLLARQRLSSRASLISYPNSNYNIKMVGLGPKRPPSRKGTGT